MTKKEAINMCMEVRHYLTQGNPIWDKDKVGEASEMAIEALKAPPITQRSMYQAGYRQAQEDRPRGEWEKATESIWKCSLCDAIMFTDSNYCPNCGADMRKDETDES